jgi:hypothetical protein
MATLQVLLERVRAVDDADFLIMRGTGIVVDDSLLAAIVLLFGVSRHCCW